MLPPPLTLPPRALRAVPDVATELALGTGARADGTDARADGTEARADGTDARADGTGAAAAAGAATTGAPDGVPYTGGKKSGGMPGMEPIMG